MLNTEKRNERTTHIDQMPVGEALQTIHNENAVILQAIDQAMPEITKACEAMVAAIRGGGRVFYIGCGTSGRLGVLDAVECPPTYGVPQELFTGIIAGGYDCLVKASENAEDQSAMGVRDLRAHGVCEKDIVIGISAAGGAAYVVHALEYARSIGAATVAIANNADTAIGRAAKISIVLETGPEVIAGSTRMKAGTSQKMVLNMLSTATMIQCGNVYENMMVNLRPTNDKLRGRVIRITRELTGLDETAAVSLLEQNEWNIRRAAEQHRKAQGSVEE